MSFSAQAKLEIIKEHQRGPSETGSPEVQVALLTARIKQGMTHFETHRKDRHSRHGLLRMVHKRRGLLKYLQRRDHARYVALIESLGLRR